MNPLDEIQARTDAATDGPWVALGTGTANGDHWYVCDDGEAIASVSSQDGINEDQREPDAMFIAHAREDVPKLVRALRAVEALHSPVPSGPGDFVQICRTCSDVDAVNLPCPTITAINEALG